jgi:hypothetical protein
MLRVGGDEDGAEIVGRDDGDGLAGRDGGAIERVETPDERLAGIVIPDGTDEGRMPGELLRRFSLRKLFEESVNGLLAGDERRDGVRASSVADGGWYVRVGVLTVWLGTAPSERVCGDRVQLLVAREDSLRRPPPITGGLISRVRVMVMGWPSLRMGVGSAAGRR